MKYFQLGCWLVLVLLGLGLVEFRTDKEQGYLPIHNGQLRAIHLILDPGKEPTGERNVVVTPIGEFVISEQPNSMTAAEIAQARRIGEDVRHQHMISLRLPSGKTSYMTYDDRTTTRQEAFANFRDFENLRLKNIRI